MRVFNIVKVLPVVFFITILVFASMAQDVNHSQYLNTPFQVNPGMVGASDDASLNLNQRGNKGIQGQEFSSSTVTGIFPVLLKNNQRIGGLGVNIFTDRSGEPNIFRHFGASTTLAYNVKLSNKYNLTYGLQMGYFERKISLDGLTTTSQYIDNYGFDPSAGSGENFSEHKVNYISIGSGLFLTGKDNSGLRKSYLGIAAFDLNKSRASFNNLSYNIPSKYSVIGGFRVYKKGNFSINPEVYYRLISLTHLYNVGTVFNYSFAGSPVGSLRNGDINFISKYSSNNYIITGFQLNQPSFSFGLTYDINVASSANSSGNQGVFEISLLLRKSMVKKIKETKTYNNYSVGEVRDFFNSEKPVLVPKDDSKRYSERLDDEEDENYDSISKSDPVKFALKREFKFKFNDSQITDAGDLAFMEELIKLLNSNKKLKMQIIGHADNVGTNEGNLKVSEQRANVVYSYLIEKGIDQRRLTKLGKGDNEPLVKNDTEEHRAINRRVEFLIFK